MIFSFLLLASCLPALAARAPYLCAIVAVAQEIPAWSLPLRWVAGSATWRTLSIANWLPLADLPGLPNPPEGSTGPFLLNVLMVIGILGACGFAWVYLRDAFGRKPPLGAEITKMAARIENVEKVVIGSATRVEMASLEKQIAADVSARLKEQVARADDYIHGMRHEMKDELHAVTLKIDDSRLHAQTAIDSKFTLLDGTRRADIAGVHEKIEATADGLRAEIEDKARETRMAIAEMPQRLITMLRDTGAIGGRKS